MSHAETQKVSNNDSSMKLSMEQSFSVPTNRNETTIVDDNTSNNTTTGGGDKNTNDPSAPPFDSEGATATMKESTTKSITGEDNGDPRRMVKDEENEENVASSNGYLEPSMESSERLSSSKSIQQQQQLEDEFVIDTGTTNNTADTNGGDSSDHGDFRDNGNNNKNSDSSWKHRSVFHSLTADPCRDENWEKPFPTKSLIWKFRLVCGKIVENPHVQLGIILLIIVNAIMMGIATFDFVTDNPDVEAGFSKLDRTFLSVFTAELILQLIYRSLNYFTDAWLVFDFVIVVISWSLESLQIVRAFRIFRAFRLVTRIGPLRELVMAIGAVMPRMYAIAMLLLLIFYIFAVLFTELFREVQTDVNYFGSLDRSLFTCMELMTLEWAGITREVMSQKSWAWAPVMAFISVTGFIVFNLIVAVVCDAVAVVDREVQAEKMGEFETDTTKLEKAQERIWDMTEHVEIMLNLQKELQEVLVKLNNEMEELTGESTGIIVTRREGMVSS